MLGRAEVALGVAPDFLGAGVVVEARPLAELFGGKAGRLHSVSVDNVEVELAVLVEVFVPVSVKGQYKSDTGNGSLKHHSRNTSLLSSQRSISTSVMMPIGSPLPLSRSGATIRRWVPEEGISVATVTWYLSLQEQVHCCADIDAQSMSCGSAILSTISTASSERKKLSPANGSVHESTTKMA